MTGEPAEFAADAARIASEREADLKDAADAEFLTSWRAELPGALAGVHGRVREACRLEGLREADLAALASYVDDAAANLALARAGARRRWSAMRRHATGDVLDVLRAQPEGAAVAGDALCAEGHNVHPLGKLRRGMRLADSYRYAPEGAGSLDVRFVAAHRSIVVLSETAPQWTARFPEAAREIESRLTDRFAPLPVHPWQLAHALRSTYAREFGDLLVPLAATRAATPSLAMRTVVTPEAALKVSLSVQLTSVPRNISPATAANAAPLSRMLAAIVRDDPRVEGVEIVEEFAGAHFAGPDAPAGSRRARDLSAIVRDRPEQRLAPEETALTAAVLVARSPASGRTVLADVLARAARHQAVSPRVAAERFLDTYAGPLVRATLVLLTGYGVGIEGHLQNVLVVLDETGMCRRLLLRDFGGPRVLLSRVEAAGYRLVPHPDSVIVADNVDAVRAKAFYTVLAANLSEIIDVLAREFAVPAGHYWRQVAGHVEAAARTLRRDHPHADADLAALRAPSVPRKAFLRMLLTPGDHYLPWPNPLRDHLGS